VSVPNPPNHLITISDHIFPKELMNFSIAFAMIVASLGTSSLTHLTIAGQDIPRDTSFTVSNTAAKVLRQYPQARLVASELPEGVEARENIVYARDGKRSLHLDMFMPEKRGAQKFPGVILVHGGGWRSGNRQMEWPMAQHLAARGYVTATVEYRLSPEALYPTGIFDLKAAIRWMRANAAANAIDPAKIAVYGCSAGGELAAFLGVTGDMKQFEGTLGNQKFSSRVQAVVDIDGILDFTDPAESAKDLDPMKPSAGKSWFGASYSEKPEIWKEASPIRYIDEKTAPMLFVNSSLPRYHAGRDEGIAKMTKLGITTEVHTIADTPHPFWLFHPWFDEAFGHIVAFLDKSLKGK
jgi:acetyl esterase/lipase